MVLLPSVVFIGPMLKICQPYSERLSPNVGGAVSFCHVPLMWMVLPCFARTSNDHWSALVGSMTACSVQGASSPPLAEAVFTAIGRLSSLTSKVVFCFVPVVPPGAARV